MANIIVNKKRIILIIIVAFILSLPYGLVEFWAHKHALSPGGNQDDVWASFDVFIPTVLLFIGIFFVTIIGLAGLIFRSVRPLMLMVVIFGCTYLFSSIVTYNITGRYIQSFRRDTFLELAKRSKPIVNAIHLYEIQYGQPPDDLKQLIPEYLSNIPSTGIGAYPDYIYKKLSFKEAAHWDEKASNWDGNPWVLYVETPLGGLNWDMFVYLPLQNYPKMGYGGYIEKIGDWGYVYE